MFKKYALACTLACSLFALSNAHETVETTPSLVTRVIATAQENLTSIKTPVKNFYKEANGVAKVALFDCKIYIRQLIDSAKNSRAAEYVSPYAKKTAEYMATTWAYVKESRIAGYTAQGVDSIKALPTSYKIGLGIAASCLVGLGIYKCTPCKKAETKDNAKK